MKQHSARRGSRADLSFEQNLVAAADALRNNTDAAKSQHVVLCRDFLKEISDVFEAKHAELIALPTEGADEYCAANEVVAGTAFYDGAGSAIFWGWSACLADPDTMSVPATQFNLNIIPI